MQTCRSRWDHAGWHAEARPRLLACRTACRTAQVGLPGGGGEYEVVEGFGW